MTNIAVFIFWCICVQAILEFGTTDEGFTHETLKYSPRIAFVRFYLDASKI